MNKLITLFTLLAALASVSAVADIPEPDEIVDCYLESNAGNPLCKKQN